MSREGDKFNNELQIVNMDDLVPRNHLLIESEQTIYRDKIE